MAGVRVATSIVAVLAIGCGKPEPPSPPPERKTTQAAGDGFVLDLPGVWKRDDSGGAVSWVSRDGSEQVVVGSLALKPEAGEQLEFVFKRLLDHRATAVRETSPNVRCDPPVDATDTRGRVARLQGRDGAWRFAYFQLGRGHKIAYVQYESGSGAWRAEEVFATVRWE